MVILAASMMSFTQADDSKRDRRGRRGATVINPGGTYRSGSVTVGAGSRRGGVSVTVGQNGVHVNGYGRDFGRGRRRGRDVYRGRGRHGRHYSHERTVVIPFYGREFGGRFQKDLIHLRQEIRQKTGLMARDYDLKSVKLLAKSRAGRGEAKLIVGGVSSYQENVGRGYYGDFYSSHPTSYDQIYMFNPAYSSNGPWMIELFGMIKVHEVVVTLSRKSRY